MIPRPYIAKWRQYAPWRQFSQIEQDLVISRTLVELFSDSFLKENLAFRGGTALHKLYLKPAARYSEDIDLVQINPGPIKPILQRIDEVLTFFEEERTTDVREHNARILYRFTSEYEEIRLRLKLEINTREHFNVLPLSNLPWEMENEWYSGRTEITIYSINELLGTKLRALYQRKKGRDLFDMYYAYQHADLNVDEMIKSFKSYMAHAVNKPPSQKEFLMNIREKIGDPLFTGDMVALLRDDIEYDHHRAFEWLKEAVIEKMD